MGNDFLYSTDRIGVMDMNTKFIILMTALISGQAIADSYKCKKPDGSFQYQQIPCANGEVIVIPDPPPHSLSSNDGLREGERALLDQANYRIEAEKGNVVPGMPEKYVLQAWGSPTKVNQTLNDSGASEQWVYSFKKKSRYGRVLSERTAYVYLENGVVTSIQQDSP